MLPRFVLDCNHGFCMNCAVEKYSKIGRWWKETEKKRRRPYL